jgi:hypothetical protein
MYDVALQLLERELGQSFRPVSTTETVKVSASFARLKHLPIHKLIRVQARKSEWEHSNIFGKLPLTDIPLEQIEITPTGIILPMTIWGSYDEAVVEYEYGFDTVPTEIDRAVTILADQLEQSGGSMYAVQTVLQSDDIQSLLQPYRTKVV